MSRVGKQPIPLPKDVSVTLRGSTVTVKGPKGELSYTWPRSITVEKSDTQILVRRANDQKQTRAYHGLVQRLISNMITGVTSGFSKELEIRGVGYRAEMHGTQLVLQLGYSHPIAFDPPPGITIEVPKPTSIIVRGIDKQAVGQVAADIRAMRPPEPYKGKGIRYAGEHVRRKVGKAGVK